MSSRILDPVNPQREATNDGLRRERQRADDELMRLDADIKKTAVSGVDAARRRADKAVKGSRRRADQKAVDASPEDVRVRQAARVEEDHALELERAQADVALTEEREARDSALSNFLLVERQHTDERLLTERKVADEALSTRDTFLAMASHDLRGILGAITGVASLLRKESPDGTPAPRRAETILRATARMERILRDLVDIASIDAGKLLVVPAAHDVIEPLVHAVEELTPTAAARAVELTVEAPLRPVVAQVDVPRLAQVLSNLIANALRYTADGGRITLSVEEGDTEVRISVRDTGPGIPAEQLELIFGRYWQADASDGRGLGLGLYISRCILEGHHGRIWAESQIGAGATFWLSVPRTP